MPKNSHSLVIQAPLERLWGLLCAGILEPGRFFPDMRHVEILDRQAGFLLRRIETDRFEVVERVTRFDKHHEIDCLLVDHPLYAGQSRQGIETLYETDKTGLSLSLTLALDWRRKDRQPDDLDLDAWLAAAAERIKAAAERAGP